MYILLKTSISALLFRPLALLILCYRNLKKRIQISAFHQRFWAVRLVNEPQVVTSTPKLLVVLSHITSLAEAQDKQLATQKIERLQRAIDGLLSSFSHCEKKIIINTVANRHITHFLPDYQQSILEIREQVGCDPMFVEFRAQEEFILHLDDYDWFLFIEDDIIIHDSNFLEKLQIFNENSEYQSAVLIPNRYEMWHGQKTYIDLIDFRTSRHFAWNRFTITTVEDKKFGECENPHAAIYCLSREQIETWARSGRLWYNQVTMVGPLESAATGCLFECFHLYKPYPNNAYFLEVEHWDTKYSRLIHQSSNSSRTQITSD